MSIWWLEQNWGGERGQYETKGRSVSETVSARLFGSFSLVIRTGQEEVFLERQVAQSLREVLVLRGRLLCERERLLGLGGERETRGNGGRALSGGSRRRVPELGDGGDSAVNVAERKVRSRREREVTTHGRVAFGGHGSSSCSDVVSKATEQATV